MLFWIWVYGTEFGPFKVFILLNTIQFQWLYLDNLAFEETLFLWELKS